MAEAPSKLKPKWVSPNGIYAPDLYRRIQKEADSALDFEEIDKAVKVEEENEIVKSLSMPSGTPADVVKVEEIPPARVKPIPFAVMPEQMEKIISYDVPALKFRRSDIQALVAGSYLFAGRIKETLKIRASDVTITEDADGNETVNVMLTTEKKKSQRNKDGILVRPVPPRRKVPVWIKGKYEWERKLVRIFLDYSDTFIKEDFLFHMSNDTDVLLDRANIEKRNLEQERTLAHYYFHKINFGPVGITKWYSGKGWVPDMAKVFMGFPHYMRHCRLTHLSTFHNLNDEMLMRIAGWTNTSMAATYVHIDLSDIIRRMGESR